MELFGKGLFIWQVWRCEGGNPQVIAQKAADASLSHVIIKIADGVFPYNVDRDSGHDFVPSVAAALREKGIKVWGWHYVRGEYPKQEAEIAVQRVSQLGLEGYVIDAEHDYRDGDKASEARLFMSQLRAGLPELPIALSSYRYPLRHSGLPYEAFLEHCNFAMPQVYFEGAHNPREQLERSVEQYMSLPIARPVIPTGPAYSRGDWRPTPEDLTEFLSAAKSLGLTAANFWSWDVCSRPEFADLWEVIRSFDWLPQKPIADMPERLVGRYNHRNPEFVAGLYNERAAHINGDRMVVGRDEIRSWYYDLFTLHLPGGEFNVTGKYGKESTRHFTWNAVSQNGSVIDGNDTLGLKDGRIQFHFTYFTVHP